MQNYMELLMKARKRYEILMQGRHGFDTLSGDLLVLWLVLGFIGGFIRSGIYSAAILAVPAAAVLRMLSKNLERRQIENAKYLKLRHSFVKGVQMRYRMFTERKTHKYYKCKNCSSYIRVKKITGEHTVACPKCGKEFRVKIR